MAVHNIFKNKGRGPPKPVCFAEDKSNTLNKPTENTSRPTTATTPLGPLLQPPSPKNCKTRGTTQVNHTGPKRNLWAPLQKRTENEENWFIINFPEARGG